MDEEESVETTEMETESSTAGKEDVEEEPVYLPGKALAKPDDLECDFSAYVMYHQAKTVAPCLSFDIIQDDLGNDRSEYPHTLYAVSGTQSLSSHTNNVIVMKMSNLHKLKEKLRPESDDEDPDDSESEEEEIDTEKPNLIAALLKHQGCINRIRVNTIDGHPFAATWSEIGKVHIWNLVNPLQATENHFKLERFEKVSDNIEPVFTFAGHLSEGYAMDWSPVMKGYLATGDCTKGIHVWKPLEGSSWIVDQRPYSGHTKSVEDIQWSPNEENVFASCSVDQSIRIWDIRVAPNKACMVTVDEAHTSDVNVISWNRHEPFIVSGGDDGVLKVWDLRSIKSGDPVALFKHHTAPITSVEWHPTDSTVFAASGSDDQLSIWDLSIEKDDDVGVVANQEVENLPPQLLFIHQGQSDIKELHWHPQIPGVIISTAQSGFNVFKTISV